MKKDNFSVVDCNGDIKQNIGHINFSDFYAPFDSKKYLKDVFNFCQPVVEEIGKNTNFYEIKSNSGTLYYVFYKDITAVTGNRPDGELRIQGTLPQEFQKKIYMQNGFFLGTYLLGKDNNERTQNQTILCVTTLNDVQSSPLKVNTKAISEAVKNGCSIYSYTKGNKLRKNYALKPELLKVWIEDHIPQFFADSLCYHTKFSSKFQRNCIFFGAPGTGKSYSMKQNAVELLGDNNLNNYERVTFHSDYSYASFVGTYKPVPIVDEDGNESITYKYVPGPFVRVLVKALRNAIAVSNGEEAEPYLLIIEEINRAHIAAVFGDIFQLLDRDDQGISEYDIHVSEDMRDYLANALECDPMSCEKIRIPDNMFIWASMNSADQGVFPMDTAFKRRWNFKYIGVDDEEFNSSGNEYQNDTFTIAGETIEWNILRRAINAKLSSEKIKLHEDKLMGVFFLKILDKESKSIFDDTTKNEDFINLFCNKVLMYLFEDAAKTKRKDMFEGIKIIDQINRYSYICEQFHEIGIKIFGDDFKTKYYNPQIDERNTKKSKCPQNQINNDTN